VEIFAWLDAKKAPLGKVIKILGRPGDNNTEMHSIAMEKGFDSELPSKVEEEAKKIKQAGIKESDYVGRRDFRKTLTFTIDPSDAKDFDDAISFKKVGDGDYEVGIHIADFQVGKFMRENLAAVKLGLETLKGVGQILLASVTDGGFLVGPLRYKIAILVEGGHTYQEDADRDEKPLNGLHGYSLMGPLTHFQTALLALRHRICGGGVLNPIGIGSSLPRTLGDEHPSGTNQMEGPLFGGTANFICDGILYALHWAGPSMVFNPLSPSGETEKVIKECWEKDLVPSGRFHIRIAGLTRIAIMLPVSFHGAPAIDLLLLRYFHPPLPQLINCCCGEVSSTIDHR